MNHPLGTIKDLATGAVTQGVTLPIRLAARSVGVVRGAASIGMHAAQEAAGRGATATAAPVDAGPAHSPDETEPVNVVEELGLDPAPVDEPAAGSSDADQPLTSIDAQAHPEDVDATPADVAERISATAPEPRHSE